MERSSHIHRLDLGIGAILTFTAVACCLLWLQPTTLHHFELNPDEGGNLAKALLWWKGQHLYSSIWSDQPPLYTALLAWWMAFFGSTLQDARLLTTACSVVTVTSLVLLVRASTGWFAGILAGVLVILSWGFVLYSYAALIGIPSLMFGVLGLTVLEYRRVGIFASNSRIPLFFGGAFMGLAITTKLYACLLLLPALVLVGLAATNEHGMNPTGKHAPKFIHLACEIAWYFVGLVFAASAVVLFCSPDLVGAFMAQLISPHQAAQKRSSLAGLRPSSFRAALREPLYLVAAGCSAYLLARHRQSSGLAPTAFLLVILLFFGLHFPIWPHYHPLLIIPLSWLIALGAHQISLHSLTFSRPITTQFDGFRHQSILSLATIGGVLCMITCISLILWNGQSRISSFSRRLRHQSVIPIDFKLLGYLKKLSPFVDEIYTDSPLYPFLIGRTVPPHLAVASQKRLVTVRDISPNRLLERLISEMPPVALSKRYNFIPVQLPPRLRDAYQVTYRNRSTCLLVRRDIAETAFTTTSSPEGHSQ